MCDLHACYAILAVGVILTVRLVKRFSGFFLSLSNARLLSQGAEEAEQLIRKCMMDLMLLPEQVLSESLVKGMHSWLVLAPQGCSR